jgi:hypothetical protein
VNATLDRAALEAAPRRLLSPARNWTKADVYAVEHDGREVVVKDFAGRPWLARQILGRRFASREARIYRTLAGVEGVPAFVGRPDAFSLAIEKIEGTRLREMPRGGVDGALFDALARTLDEVHARGVALSDLHHRNVLLSAGGPYLLDLAMGVDRRAGLRLLGRLLFRVFSRLDRVALLRMKRRYTGSLTSEEQAVLARGAGTHRVGRALKAILNAARLGKHAGKPL